MHRCDKRCGILIRLIILRSTWVITREKKLGHREIIYLTERENERTNQHRTSNPKSFIK